MTQSTLKRPILSLFESEGQRVSVYATGLVDAAGSPYPRLRFGRKGQTFQPLNATTGVSLLLYKKKRPHTDALMPKHFTAAGFAALCIMIAFPATCPLSATGAARAKKNAGIFPRFLCCNAHQIRHGATFVSHLFYGANQKAKEEGHSLVGVAFFMPLIYMAPVTPAVFGNRWNNACKKS